MVNVVSFIKSSSLAQPLALGPLEIDKFELTLLLDRVEEVDEEEGGCWSMRLLEGTDPIIVLLLFSWEGGVITTERLVWIVLSWLVDRGAFISDK